MGGFLSLSDRTVLIHEMHEHGIVPGFASENGVKVTGSGEGARALPYQSRSTETTAHCVRKEPVLVYRSLRASEPPT